ncbi:Methyltransferase domain-containing protein [Desulfonatronum zhilinae]|nr:Methyltransferase domain-containing protein [Desulfonatronum zhilinae]
MFIEELANYRCPVSMREMKIVDSKHNDIGEVVSGRIQCADFEYLIEAGIPDFTYPKELPEADFNSRVSYNSVSEDYDNVQNVTFKILEVDENEIRSNMIDFLQLELGHRVLETAAGTGLNFPFIVRALNGKGELYAQDISNGMLQKAKAQYHSKKYQSEMFFSYSICNAAYLPFPDNYFDAAFSFGGIGVFSDQKRAICEMCRVVKPQGRVVFGDEGVAPWLRAAEYGKILIDNNKFYQNEVPLDLLPVDARDLCVRWIMGGGFYLVDFTVGEGEPVANFDYPIPGQRGGTLRTRYYGKLEGVSPETQGLVRDAAKKCKLSMHDWLDAVLKDAANITLKGK